MERSVDSSRDDCEVRRKIDLCRESLFSIAIDPQKKRKERLMEEIERIFPWKICYLKLDSYCCKGIRYFSENGGLYQIESYVWQPGTSTEILLHGNCCQQIAEHVITKENCRSQYRMFMTTRYDFACLFAFLCEKRICTIFEIDTIH